MNEILKSIRMTFNDEYVGHLDVYRDGSIIPEFVECDAANDCIYFLTTYALAKMMQPDFPIKESPINLN